MVKVLVLMSTYNGGLYLEEQLKCLKNQKGVHVDILVRDDGSTDNTLDILKKWEENIGLNWYSGENLKPAKSFMDLLFKAPDYDFYAFCDQDDIWKEDKLDRAIRKINSIKTNHEILYASGVTVVDNNLNVLYEKRIKRQYKLPEAMIRNNIIGCTIVFNKKMLDTLKEYRPNYLDMHDSWIYKVCLCVGGNVIIDQESRILYRQHENNVLGTHTSTLKRLNQRMHAILNRSNYGACLTAKELLMGYGDQVSEYDRELLEKLLKYKSNFRSKLSLIYDSNFNTGRLYQKILFCIDVFLENI